MDSFDNAGDGIQLSKEEKMCVTAFFFYWFEEDLNIDKPLTLPD